MNDYKTLTSLSQLLVEFRSTFYVAHGLWNVPEADIQKVRLFTKHTDIGACWFS